MGFSTGSGKSIAVSAASLRRAEEMLACEEGISGPHWSGGVTVPTVADPVQTMSFQDENGTKRGAPAAFAGFSTGSMKKVTVSDAALKRGTALMQDSRETDESHSKPGAPAAFAGFSTGSMKKISVSSDSLQQARALFGKDTSIASESPERSCLSQSTFSGFSTGSMKKVEVSNAALEKGSALLHQTPVSKRSHTELQFGSAFKTPLQQGSPRKAHKRNASIQKQRLARRTSELFRHVPAPPKFDTLKYLSSKEAESFRFGQKGVNAAVDRFRTKKVGEEWVRNHYRWIVWKIVSRQLRQKKTSNLDGLFSEVIRQLEHRYKKEFEDGKSSCLKQVLERDEFPSRIMVLMVASMDVDCPMYDAEDKDAVCSGCIEVSDGWYSIHATMDQHMHHYAAAKLRPGYKIISFGASVVGQQDGCSPLENQDAKLALHVNGTRRAKGCAMLGFQPFQSMTFDMNTILYNGGCVPEVQAMVVRQYPIMFMHLKKGERAIIRTEYAEIRAQEQHAQKLEMWVELLSCDSFKEIERLLLRSKMEEAEQARIRDLFQKLSTCASLREKYDSIHDMVREEPMLLRRSFPIMTLKMRDMNNRSDEHEYILKVRNANHEVAAELAEGQSFRFFGLQVEKYSDWETKRTVFCMQKPYWVKMDPASPMPHVERIDVDLPPHSVAASINQELDLVAFVLECSTYNDTRHIYAMQDRALLYITMPTDQFKQIAKGKFVRFRDLVYHRFDVRFAMHIFSAVSHTSVSYKCKGKHVPPPSLQRMHQTQIKCAKGEVTPNKGLAPRLTCVGPLRRQTLILSGVLQVPYCQPENLFVSDRESNLLIHCLLKSGSSEQAVLFPLDMLSCFDDGHVDLHRAIEVATSQQPQSVLSPHISAKIQQLRQQRADTLSTSSNPSIEMLLDAIAVGDPPSASSKIVFHRLEWELLLHSLNQWLNSHPCYLACFYSIPKPRHIVIPFSIEFE